LKNLLGYGKYYLGEEQEKFLGFRLKLYTGTVWLGFSFLQVAWKTLECAIYRGNSAEILVGFSNLENFLSWDGNIT